MEYLLPHLLSNSAARRPTQEAVRLGGRGLTYAELDRLSNRLAAALLAVGVRRGDRVGIYLAKSFASVIGVFGILKAGAVYVPLDASAPVKRLAYITRNCGLRVLLTDSVKLGNLPALFAEETPLQTVVLMEAQPGAATALPPGTRLLAWDEVQSYRGEVPPPCPAPETDLAYLLYTSGSTGSPKGVMISHRTILTFINWAVATFRLTDTDRVTSHAPLHFDLSTFDLYATIKAGGTVVLVPEGASVFPMHLAELLAKESITVTYLVPSILTMMVNYGKLESHDLSRLRAVLFAGEVFPLKYLRRLVQAVPCAQFYNLYGPTETNVCTYYKVRTEDLAPDRSESCLPIGKACENTEVFAVGEDGQLVSDPGQEGELWVRGPGVAQGYWADPDKTNRAFVRNPFQPHYPDIAYRTGDFVRLSPDRENWLFVGRRDHMIKSRGYRVELGEIESALYRHEAVKEAAVVAIPDEFVGNRLRAFVVPHEGRTAVLAELEDFCQEHLPRYMVPEKIELRPELPKTSSGKTDRTALAREALGPAAHPGPTGPAGAAAVQRV